MAHESLEPGRTVIYNLPTLPSDSLRTLEFSQFFRDYHGPRFLVRTGDGWSWPSPAPRSPEFVAVFRSRADLDAVIGDRGETQLSRTFLKGGLEIQGNIFALLSVAEYTLLHAETLSNGLVHTLRVWIDRLRQAQTRTVSEAFRPAYRAWLFYLVEIATSLNAGELQVHRVLLRRPRRTSSIVC